MTMPDGGDLRPEAGELLAPAGNLEKLETAIRYGADAVYLGCDAFSLRTHKASFSLQELPQAVKRAHTLGARAYVALNILARPDDLPRLQTAMDPLQAAKPDAFIVSDPGVFGMLRQRFPSIPLHVSTQASVTNALTCRFWHQQGARRIILARELTLAEIAAIRRDVPQDLQLEVFVHGAMCVAWSGRCLLSDALTGRSANQGACAQPCRWQYHLREGKDADKELFLQEDEAGSYLLSSKDLCLIEHLPKLLDAGVDSFKIEGRTKSSFYVATVVKAYRQALDAALRGDVKVEKAWLEWLDQTVHRPFGTGFLFSPPQEKASVSPREDYRHVADVVALVKGYLADTQRVVLEQKNKIHRGDRLQLMTPGQMEQTFKVDEIYDLEGTLLDTTPHPGMLYALPASEPWPKGSFLRRLGSKKEGSDASKTMLPEKREDQEG